MEFNDEEALGLMNRLLESLHQAGGDHHCSHYSFVYVASGGQHVDHQYIFGDKVQGKRPVPDRGGELPEVLATDEAMALWRKAQDAGYIDEHYQPKISRTQAALLADTMAERLGIKEKWKVFEGLWHRKYMRSDYNLALTRKKTLDFQDELKRLFG